MDKDDRKGAGTPLALTAIVATPCPSCIPRAWADAAKPLYVPMLTAPLHTGQVGRLRSLKVLQVLNDHEILASVDLAGSSDDLTLWITGVSTKDVADGEHLSGVLSYTVEGPKQYTTALGAQRTVFQVRAESLVKPKEITEPEEPIQRASGKGAGSPQ